MLSDLGVALVLDRHTGLVAGCRGYCEVGCDQQHDNDASEPVDESTPAPRSPGSFKPKTSNVIAKAKTQVLKASSREVSFA